jgi:putative copper export protein
VTAPLGAITGWLLFATLVIALGSLAGRWVLAPQCGRAPAEGPTPSDVDPPGSTTAVADPRGSTTAVADLRGSRTVVADLVDSAARVGLLAALLLPIAMGLVFLRQLAEFRDPFVPWTEDAALLLGTSWGRTWIIAASTSLVAPIVFRLCRGGRRGAWPVATLVVVALSAFPALTGHAAGAEGLRPVTLVADTLHVLAAGTWLGGLAFVLFAERRHRLAFPEDTSLLPVLVPAFSRLAIVSVAVLMVTGVVASWVHLGSLAALTATDYGRLLSIKLILVGMVLVLGATNWRVLTPRLGAPGGPAALRRAAVAELALGQLVLLVTAVLVRTSPLAP